MKSPSHAGTGRSPMRASQLWPRDTKIIEFGVEDQPVGLGLLDAGFDKYLAVVATEPQRQQLARRFAGLRDRLAVADASSAVRRNNADVLLLSGAAAWSTLRFRNLRHARAVAVPWRFDLRIVVALMACLWHVLLRRCDRPRWVSSDAESNRGTKLVVFPIRRRRESKGARHYVPQTLGVDGLLRRFRDRNLRHVVLRWFESLPELPAGEDLDLLVDDANLQNVFELLDEGPGLQPCDVYSVTGLPRSDFRGMSYFPPVLAEVLLDHAQVHAELCCVPSPKHHFLSLAYHALYHKGPKSGLPSRLAIGRRPKSEEHDYSMILRDLAERLRIDVEITREGLDEYLAGQGWRPPLDLLRRLGRRQRWIADSLRQRVSDGDQLGLAVFLVRQEAMNRGGVERVTALLERIGFSILRTQLFSDSELRRAARNIRGGNWGRGPWGLSGGPPVAAVVALDHNPLPLSWRQQRRFPLVTNARLLEKERLREEFNEGFPPDQHCNVLHSSDNAEEAWEYLRLAMPEAETEIRLQLASLREAFQTTSPVLQDLTRFGVRAKVERIEHAGRPALRKTFKPGRERFCHREVFAMQELSRLVPEIPPLLAAEESSVTCPFYEDVLCYQRSSGKLIPLPVAKQAIGALRKIYEAGFALIDANIDNVLVDRREGLKLIDFEFLHRYEQPPSTFVESFDIAGCPADFEGDQPSGGGKSYRKNWLPYVGLSLDSLLSDPTWLQQVKRTIYVATHAHRYLPRRARQLWRDAMSAIVSRMPSHHTGVPPLARPQPERVAHRKAA